MSLKLEVPLPNGWTKRLQVDFHREIGKIREVGESGTSYHPRVQIDGDDVLVENFFGENNKVPDVSRYRIGEGYVPHDYKYRIYDDRYIIPHCNYPEHAISHCDIYGSALEQQLQQQQIGNIVLLLESPHKAEYTDGGRVYDINRPQAPANGDSGTKIDECLGKVLSKITEEFVNAGLDVAELIVPDSHVIISNPIQFQTSLNAVHGEPLKDNDDYMWATLRDFVWRTLWEEQHIRNSFQERLNTYNPSLIVNACTGSSLKSGAPKRGTLKSLVTKFVRAVLPNVTLYNVGHPASWRSCDRISPKRIYPPANQNAG